MENQNIVLRYQMVNFSSEMVLVEITAAVTGWLLAGQNFYEVVLIPSNRNSLVQAFSLGASVTGFFLIAGVVNLIMKKFIKSFFLAKAAVYAVLSFYSIQLISDMHNVHPLGFLALCVIASIGLEMFRHFSNWVNIQALRDAQRRQMVDSQAKPVS